MMMILIKPGSISSSSLSRAASPTTTTHLFQLTDLRLDLLDGEFSGGSDLLLAFRFHVVQTNQLSHEHLFQVEILFVRFRDGARWQRRDLRPKFARFLSHVLDHFRRGHGHLFRGRRRVVVFRRSFCGKSRSIVTHFHFLFRRGSRGGGDSGGGTLVVRRWQGNGN